MSERPTHQQIAEAIRRVHKALREAWPESTEELTPAFGNVTPMQFLNMAKAYGAGRELWIKNTQDAVGMFPLAESAEVLQGAVEDFIALLEREAQGFRLVLMKMLDDPGAGGAE